jgi:hypothetical protein
MLIIWFLSQFLSYLKAWTSSLRSLGCFRVKKRVDKWRICLGIKHPWLDFLAALLISEYGLQITRHLLSLLTKKKKIKSKRASLG